MESYGICMGMIIFMNCWQWSITITPFMNARSCLLWNVYAWLPRTELTREFAISSKTWTIKKVCTVAFPIQQALTELTRQLDIIYFIFCFCKRGDTSSWWTRQRARLVSQSEHPPEHSGQPSHRANQLHFLFHATLLKSHQLLQAGMILQRE